MAFAPIWKDRLVTLGTSAYEDYTIEVGGNTIYTGRAYLRPGEASVTARINEVCADYITATFPNLGSNFTGMKVSETFDTIVGGVTKDSITFVNDWSYDPDRVLSTNNALSDPIDGFIDPRQWLVFSILSGATSVPITIHFTDSTTAVVSVPVAMTADFNDDFNGDFVQSADPSKSGTAVLDLSQFTDIEYITFLDQTLYIKESCAKYAVYYVNAYGGWDSFILEGYENRRDTLTRHTKLVEYDNTDLSARGRKDYAIEVVPSWTLNTGFLNADQSSRMHHLLNSTEVYLCELSTGDFSPVVLTDTENERKQRGAIFYQFNAQLAQERFRR